MFLHNILVSIILAGIIYFLFFDTSFFSFLIVTSITLLLFWIKSEIGQLFNNETIRRFIQSIEQGEIEEQLSLQSPQHHRQINESHQYPRQIADQSLQTPPPARKNVKTHNGSFRSKISHLFKRKKTSSPLKKSLSADSIKPDNECIICMNSKINTILLPCCHMELCNECALAINECCTCREKIVERRYVFSPLMH